MSAPQPYPPPFAHPSGARPPAVPADRMPRHVAVAPSAASTVPKNIGFRFVPVSFTRPVICARARLLSMRTS